MELSQVINTESKAIPMKQMKSVGDDSVFLITQTALDANEVILYETDKPFILDLAEFSGKTNVAFSGPFIYTKIGGVMTQISRCVRPDAANAYALTSTQFENVFTYGSTMFDSYFYDATSSTAKIALKEPMYFPNGIRIAVKCSSGTSTIASMIYGRVMK